MGRTGIFLENPEVRTMIIPTLQVSSRAGRMCVSKLAPEDCGLSGVEQTPTGTPIPSGSKVLSSTTETDNSVKSQVAHATLYAHSFLPRLYVTLPMWS